MSDELAGKVGPHRESHEPRLDATKFSLGAVSGFLTWNGTQGIGEHWNMLHNDVYGDCGPAATNHGDMAKANDPKLAGELGKPTFDGVLGTYWAYGRAQGESGQHPDQGVDNASWLGFLYKHGIIYGYGEVPLDSLDWFAQQAKGAIVGLVIDGNQAISDFNQSPKVPWAAMPNASDGHDTLLIITNGDGSGSLVTWGGVQPFTPEFRAQITDAWIIYDKDDPNVDHAALLAALADVHGTVESPTTESEGIVSDIENEVHKVEGEIEHVADEAKGLLEGSSEAPGADSEAVGVAEAAQEVTPAGDLKGDIWKAFDLAHKGAATADILQVLQDIIKAYS